MAEFSEQKLVVVCNFNEHIDDVIVHGVRMADILKKELCLFGMWEEKKQKNETQQKLITLTRNIKSEFSGLQVSSLILRNKLRNNIEKLVNDYNAVLLILHQSDIKHSMKAFRESSIPFLFVNGNRPEFLQYKNALVPVDYRKASKETSLWASYLGRFNRSHVQVIYAHEKDSDQAKQLMRNVNFFRKFFSGLHVRHSIIEGKSSSWGICNEALRRSKELNADLLIFSGSAFISLIDLLIGLPEKKIVLKAGCLPVMLINPRKDICMMCD